MPFLTRNKIILAKIETTYGTDPTPTGIANAIMGKNFTRNIYEGNRVSRDIVYTYMGNDEEINTGPFVTVTFDVEFAGCSAAGVAPQFDALLRACGLGATIVATTSVTYNPVSTAHESVSLYFNYDGENQVIVGARGTMQLSMQRGGLPMMSFTFTGKYARPTAVALPTPTYTGQTPRPFNNTNTTVSVHSTSAIAEAFSLDLGNSIAHQNLPGADRVLFTDRNATGSVTLEATAIATKDWFAAAESHGGTITKAPIVVTHGPTAGTGKRCVITASTAQINNISETDVDGIRFFQLPFRPIPNAGNDDFSIAFT
jgi:hypothetical protein